MARALTKGRVIGIGIVLLWGLVKLPMETAFAVKMKEQRFGQFEITSSLREQAGQAGLLAVLGGLRSAVADLLWIRAHMAWEDRDYAKMKLFFDVCTALQPRRVDFWDVASWHMAYNGGEFYRTETLKAGGDEIASKRAAKEFHVIGENYLLEGVKNCPDSWVLYDRLGTLYRDKFHDACKAAAAYAEAAKRPNRLDYTRRFAVYMLAECPGHEQEAYDKLVELYNEGEHEWLPTLLAKVQILEEKLGVPKDRRLYIPPKERLRPK